MSCSPPIRTVGFSVGVGWMRERDLKRIEVLSEVLQVLAFQREAS
jgi:hypothetical protein